MSACFFLCFLDLLLVVPVTATTPGIACQSLNEADATRTHDTVVPGGQKSAMKTDQCLALCS